MEETHASGTTMLSAVSKAMTTFHKEQFGRGPTNVRSNFAGPDTLVCVLEDVLLPAELKMVELGDQARVREARVSFQVATADDFVKAVEEIVHRKVRAFASAVDPDSNVVFENFYFERESAGHHNGRLTTERAHELGEDGQVGVQPNPVQVTDEKRSERPVVLQSAELALDGSAATVQSGEAERLARDQRI